VIKITLGHVEENRLDRTPAVSCRNYGGEARAWSLEESVIEVEEIERCQER